MGSLATPEPMNSTAPTGGVSRPMPQLRTTMMPNCTGSSPQYCVAMGSRMGVAIRMMGAMSMMQPRISRIRLSSRIRITRLSVRPTMALAASSGTCSMVRQLPNTAEVAIRMRTMPSVSTQLPSSRHTPFQSRPR